MILFQSAMQCQLEALTLFVVKSQPLVVPSILPEPTHETVVTQPLLPMSSPALPAAHEVSML